MLPKSWILCILFVVLIKRLTLSKDLKLMPKSLNCVCSNKTIEGKSMKCWVKIYGRSVATINSFMNITRPVYNLLVSQV